MQQDAALPTMNSLWIGADPGQLQILCLLSAVARGHRVRLFGYRRFQNVPDCIEQADAREILPEAGLFLDKATGSPAPFADRFRYRLISRGMGAWMDADMLFLKPVQAINGNIFGWEDDRHHMANIALLAYDPNSDLAEELLDWSSRDEMIPPWMSRRKRLGLYFKARLGHVSTLAELPWGTIGPHLFTYLIRKLRMTHEVSDWQRFYPISYARRALPFSSAADAEALLAPHSATVHLWHQGLDKVGRRVTGGAEIPFEANSLVWKVAGEVGLRPYAA